MNLNNICIVSNRQKGIRKAIESRYPPKNHCYCCRHIAENIVGKFKEKGIVVQFWCGTKAYRRSEYDDHMTIIRRILMDAYNYVSDINRKRWANPLVISRQYDILTTNLAESTNNQLKNIREYSITTQVEAICQ